MLRGEGTATIIAGTGEEGEETGSGRYADFGKPICCCTEDNNIFVTDAQIGSA